MPIHIFSEREAVLVEMWNENKSQREIANALGVTIGVVSGIAMRLKQKGLIKHKSKEFVRAACVRAAAKPAPVKEAKVEAPAPEKPAPRIAKPGVTDESRIGIDIMKLNSETCHWVLPRKNADGMALYCGDEVYHRSFCQCHAARAFQIPHDWKVSSTPYRRLQALITTK